MEIRYTKSIEDELSRITGKNIVLLPICSNKKTEETGLQNIIAEHQNHNGKYRRLEYSPEFLTIMPTIQIEDEVVKNLRIVFFAPKTYSEFFFIKMHKTTNAWSCILIDAIVFSELLSLKKRFKKALSSEFVLATTVH
jgi:hypothetical protein